LLRLHLPHVPINIKLMAGWVAKFLPSNDSQSKDTESENHTVSPTGGGGIASFISGLLWSGDDTSVGRDQEHQQISFQEPKDKVDKSWEDVDMAELKPKVSRAEEKSALLYSLNLMK
jgi:hypothetical protein